MIKLLLLLVPLLAFSSQADIFAKIQALQDEIEALKKEVAQQQKEVKKQQVVINNQKEDIQEHLPILEKVETKSILDKLNFSPELLLRADQYDYTNGQIGSTPNYENTKIYDNNGVAIGDRRDGFSKHYNIASFMRFRLNMSMELEDIKFHGRLIYANSSQSNQRVCILSKDIKSGTSGSAFDVDRAYVDYSPNKNSSYPFTFSFGILPTTAGTPMQYQQNKKRSSLFPALVFNMNSYGLIATQKLAKETYARAVLAKAYTLRENFYPYQCNRENIDNADIVGLYADTKFSLFGDSLLSFGVNMLHDLKAHPYLGPDVTASNAKILGNMFTFGLGLDVENFLDTHTTIFAHTAISNPHPNGAKEDYQIVQTPTAYKIAGLTKNGYTGFTTADYASGTMLNSNGYSFYLGAKYDFTQNLHLGGEFNHGSKYWFSATQGAEDIYNKLALRGNVYELYLTWQFYKYLSAKFSYLNMHENYTGSGWHFGEPATKDATQKIESITLEAKF